MISMTINAESPEAFRNILQGLLGSAAETAPVTAPENVTPEKPKATRSTKATKTEDAKPATIEATSDQASSPSDTGPTATTAASPSEPVTEASLRARATAYAAKAGPTALVEMQKVAGAANGKMSEVVASPDAMTKLDALLADAGF